MRALRSRTVTSDSGSEDSKKSKRKMKKNSKRKSETQSTSENDTTLEAPPKRITRKSMSSKETKENVSPNVRKPSRKSKKKTRRNKSKDKSTETDDSQNNTTLETTFKNVVTSTTMKPKRPKKSKTPEKTVDLLNTTYLKVDEEPSIPKTTNNSGQWKIETNSVINISDDSMMKTSPIETKKVAFNESITRSTRKKWQCFARNSQGANSILEQIGTPKKKSPITTNSTRKSTNKIKRTVMPNFALIHQKAFDKMESIADYSQRKKERAILLASGSKKNTTVETTTNISKISKVKSSRQLFSNEANNTNTNRFGFKPLTKPPVNKPSLYERNDVISIANKKPQTTNKRDTKRDALKGVRTNRRFELLMKMRNTK